MNIVGSLLGISNTILRIANTTNGVGAPRLNPTARKTLLSLGYAVGSAGFFAGIATYAPATLAGRILLLKTGLILTSFSIAYGKLAHVIRLDNHVTNAATKFSLVALCASTVTTLAVSYLILPAACINCGLALTFQAALIGGALTLGVVGLSFSNIYIIDMIFNLHITEELDMVGYQFPL